MAGNLKPARLLLLAACVAAAGFAYAVPPESLPDPTRPPAVVAGNDAGAVADISSSRLTSVVLPKNGRPAAVIEGQVVPLGGMVGGARLTRVTESGVVLEGPDGIERLFLTPDVEKKSSVTKRVAKRQKDKP
ncbi:MAG: biosis protein MshK [Pseudomonadota bacterium]|nr:biosis protein MshK [Pseudomonadota bacterium]MDQ5882323.1 biosis protein MshK [Pseudomonadota bacterium]MDQ5903254.1 biosis protein MshK [Pseudomonadota bacterium]MDQ5915726.1 biosis protein MshK [Pseudomonadota bacterium]MDQ5944689.1 biosis protein MshK [Pseudomonadota bacterium]